ncbi:MAG TPA: DUF1256 domain-containing protein, partial [Clostridia bacterium]|nr:DUF1256 domain-containing protein [Clostridia bacterium]
MVIIDCQKSDCIFVLKKRLRYFLKERAALTVVCPGTDRWTGDCLGPLVGTGLEKKGLSNIRVFGTLEKPLRKEEVHEAVRKARMREGAVIIVDSALGNSEDLYKIYMSDEEIVLGRAVN